MEEKVQCKYTIYRPEKECIGIIVVVHGMMEHRKRYDYFATKCSEAGYAVLTYDQRGHGETASSEEELGFFAKTRGWKLLIQDCLEMVQMMKREYIGVPCILFGHSMGSIVARSFIKRHDNEIQALILSGAPFYNKSTMLGYKLTQLMAIFKGSTYRSDLLKDMVLGQFNKKVLDPKTSCDWVSKNEENVKKYIADPLCQFNFTISAYGDLMFGVMDMHDTLKWNLRNSNLPILFISGSEDPCTGGEKGLLSSINTLKEAGYQYIETRLYTPLRHEILNEKNRDQVIGDCISWLERVKYTQ